MRSANSFWIVTVIDTGNGSMCSRFEITGVAMR
jgi:hypothetical protein